AVEANAVTVDELALFTVVVVIVGIVVGGSVRSLISSHQRSLARWWDTELGTPADLLNAPPTLSDANVRRMVATRDFYPVFQPIYALDDGRMIAVEALTRFDSEPPLPPSQWFGRAAELGMGTQLETIAIEKAIESSKNLRPHIILSVNVSATTLASELLLDVVTKAAQPLMLELTELEPVHDYIALRQAIAKLRKSGALIAIDNVGASLTSLRHITRITPDVIKLDSSITNDIDSDPLMRSLTQRLLRYARSSRTLLVAEGIEEPEDLARWRERGVQAAQGYLLGRPGPLTFVEVFDFPAPRVGLLTRSSRKAAAKSGDVGRGDDGLSSSQLDEPTSWGHDR
ncbi:MAG: EAL domain-containing protein, partial [Acidimicrobiia bacterium]